MIVKVAEGDTLAQIAATWHTTVEALRAVNELLDDHLEAGMRLIVEGYLVHVWMPDDTVEDVAIRYGVAPDAIRLANSHIAVGCAVHVPI